ncbi:MAG: hypothetical protein KBA71_04180 [Opitutaceae bacterium]|nr:hypothetical protein [Opitutaceae bacterium]
MDSIVTLLGRFHPLVVHLPIGILFLLAVVEVFAWFPRFPRIPDRVRTLILVVAAMSAIAASAFGWLLARGGEYDAAILDRHRYLGIAATVLALALLVFHRLRWQRTYTILWISAVAVLSLAGHYGGSLTHGSDYLAFHFGKGPAVADLTKVTVFDGAVHPILEQRCFACHGASKSNGELRYDSWEAMEKGGKNGPSFKAGNAAGSLMIQRAHLPLEAKEHMPPKGKPQLSENELSVLEWWIDSGASKDLKLANADMPSYITEMLVGRFPALRPPVPERAASLASAVELERKLGVMIRPLAVDSPWFSANARQSGGNFGDAQLESLGPVALALTSLDLGETDVTDEGLKALVAMKNLRRLSLDRTRITDAGLQNLSGLKYLEYLNVHTTAVTDAGLAALKPLRQLRSLYVWQTKVTPAATEELSSRLVDHRRIRRLEDKIADLENEVRNQQFNANFGIRSAPSAKPSDKSHSGETVSAVAVSPPLPP